MIDMQQKYFLYTKSEGPIQFSINPQPDNEITTQEHRILEFSRPKGTAFSVTVDITDRPDHKSFLLIDKVVSGNIQLQDINLYSTYITESGNRKTNGYLDEVGKFTMKFRGSPLWQVYITSLIQTARKNSIKSKD